MTFLGLVLTAADVNPEVATVGGLHDEQIKVSALQVSLIYCKTEDNNN